MQVKSVVVECSSSQQGSRCLVPLYSCFFFQIVGSWNERRLITMIFLRCKSIGHIDFNVLQALGKKLEVL